LILWYLYVASSKKIDILHPQSRDDFIGATIAGKILRKKVIWTDHADLKYVFQNHKVWYENPVGKLVHLSSRLADKITLVSHNEKILIEKSLGKKTTNKYVVIHNGVSDTAYEPTKRSHDDKDAIIFSATSRLVTAKGIGELIDAFLAIETKHNIRLWILGVGPEEKKFKTKAKASNNISFLGYPENALNYVASSDIFVHPSYHEGFSISLVEAAMLGKPIIACAVGGNPEIIENNRNGVLIKEKSADELCEAMEFLIKNPNKRKTYSINIRKTYDENFNFHNIVQDKFVRLYEQ
jgi:glycosyltransferase involved in cell wall biosynthesis